MTPSALKLKLILLHKQNKHVESKQGLLHSRRPLSATPANKHTGKQAYTHSNIQHVNALGISELNVNYSK